MSKKFDISEIDEALPDAEKMQEKDRMTDALENNYEAVGILSDRVERLENKLSETLSGLDGVLSSLRRASTVTVSEESKRMLEQEGENICRKIAGRMESEGAKLAGRLSANNRVPVSATAFWCMIETIIFLLTAFICICVANEHFIHDPMLWKILGYTATPLVVCIALTIFVCNKLRQ